MEILFVDGNFGAIVADTPERRVNSGNFVTVVSEVRDTNGNYNIASCEGRIAEARV